MSLFFMDPVGVGECSREELLAALAIFWPMHNDAAAREEDAFHLIVDGHWHVGFSLRLFGPADPEEQALAAARRAVELVQRGLEDAGYETTRTGNAWQDGRLVLGWAITTDGARIVDLPEDHPAKRERIARLSAERQERDQRR